MKALSLSAAALVLLAAGCTRDLGIPDPPDPTRPGSITGNLVYAQVGLGALKPASGALITLVGTGLSTKSGTDGRFKLTPISTSTGVVLIQFDADGDGTFERQREYSLDDIGAGLAKDVDLGEVHLGDNATVRGSVLRADLSTLSAGHQGTAIFVPEGPFTVYSGDNGGFTLENLPEGRITLAFFREGYDSAVADVDLRAGEVFSLATVLLTPQPTTPAPSKVDGFALLSGQTSHAGTTVTLSKIGATTTTDVAGHFTFPQVPQGIYSVGFQHDGYLSAVLTNVLIDQPTVTLTAVPMSPGTSTPPDLDGGIVPFDAGTPPPDAGSGDAGVDAGNPRDGGSDAGVDAGFDAGVKPLPTAVIDPVPPFVRTGMQVTLIGQNSSGDRPLTYSWRQDAGTAVSLSANNSALAATTTFTAPFSPTSLHFGLYVTDVDGGVSLPAEVTLPVGTPPTANIAAGYPTTVLAGQHVVLDGSGSTDLPTNSGLVGYSWSVMPSSITAIPKNGGAQLELDMPGVVQTAQIISVSLTVTDGLGMTSTNAATATLTLSTASAPAWYVDAGALPTPYVAGGQTVTLTAQGYSPGVPGVTFSYQWAPAQTPDAGVPDWVLNDPNIQTPKLVAPIISGASRTLPFTVTVTPNAGSGLVPASLTWPVSVVVQDETPPTLVGSSIDASGNGGCFAISLDFSEPIDPTSLNGLGITVPGGALYGAPGISQRLLDNNRVTLVLRPMAIPGNQYIVNVNGVQDLPNKNRFVGSTPLPWLARSPWSAASVSAQSSTVAPTPGLVVRSPPGQGPSAFEELVFARKENAPWFMTPFAPTTCVASACTMTDEPGAPTAVLDPTPARGHRGILWNNTALATIQLRDYVGDAGVAYARTDAGWQLMQPPPGPMFLRNGSQLTSAYANNGLYVASFDPSFAAWNFADAGLVSSSATDFSSDSTSDPLVQANATAGTDLMLIGRTSKTGQVKAFRWASSTTWQASLGVTTGSPITDIRLQGFFGYGGAAWFGYQRANGQVELVLYGDVNNGASNFIPLGTTSFDMLLDNSTLWIVATVNGQLELHNQFLGSGQFNIYPGTSGTSFNNDPSCFADQVEMTQLNGRIFFVWQEKCGAGPWKVYSRSLN